MQKIGIRQITGKRSRAKDKPAVDLPQLFEQLYPKVYNYLRYRVNNIEDAEDLTNVVFERAFTARDQYDDSKGAFSTWLFRIAHNTLVDHFRSNQRRATWEDDAGPPSDIATPEPTLESQVAQQEMVATVLGGLAQLGERDQEIIGLKFAGGLKNTEIGDVLDMKAVTVSVALLRAMRRLREQLEREVIR